LRRWKARSPKDLLKQAKGGADFAALAKKFFGKTSRPQRTEADLDYFGRGPGWCPKFDESGLQDGARPNQPIWLKTQ